MKILNLAKNLLATTLLALAASAPAHAKQARVQTDLPDPGSAFLLFLGFSAMAAAHRQRHRGAP